MKCENVTRVLVIAAGVMAKVAGQTKVDLRSQSQNIDFSNAQTVKPLPIGENLPGDLQSGANVLQGYGGWAEPVHLPGAKPLDPDFGYGCHHSAYDASRNVRGHPGNF